MSYENEAGTAPERIDIGGTVPEEMPSFAELADPIGGAWPKAWYSADIIEGYTTPNGHTFTTKDAPSRNGDSRNLTICLSLDGGKVVPGQTRTTFVQFNYRAEDLTAARVQQVMQARKNFAGQKGKWIGNEDIQRSSIAMGKFGQLEEALGFRLPKHPEGHFAPVKLVTQKVDVRLGMDEDDKYNEVNAFAKAGTKAKK
jgi:hypothetical protein